MGASKGVAVLTKEISQSDSNKKDGRLKKKTKQNYRKQRGGRGGGALDVENTDADYTESSQVKNYSPGYMEQAPSGGP